MSNDTNLELSYINVTGFLMVLYSSLFIIGFTGNLIVVSSIARSFCVRRVTNKENNQTSDHLRIYIGFLCLADLCVLSVIPLILVDIKLGDWVFGKFICKYFWTMENVGKLISVALVAVLSIDRYIAVRYPFNRFCLQSRTTAFGILLGCALTALAALSPLLIYADVQNFTVTFEQYNQSITKWACVVDRGASDQLLQIFICYTFVLGYCLPFLFIFVSYGKLVNYLRKRPSKFLMSVTQNPITEGSSLLILQGENPHHRSMKDRHNRTNRSIVGVTLFHLCCWTPYWLSTMAQMFDYNFTGKSPYMSVLMMVLHALPFANSAGNWLFYVLLNNELRKTIFEGIFCIKQKRPLPPMLYSLTEMDHTQQADTIETEIEPRKITERRNAICYSYNTL